jgi:hypothetical protein
MSNVSLVPWEKQQLINNQPSCALTVVHPAQPRVRSVPSQQLPYYLAPELFFQTTNIDESILFCAERFSYAQCEISVARLNMDEALVLSVDGQAYHITEKVHGELCKMLCIPLAFSYDIPVDLTSPIVQRLKSLHAQSMIMVSRGDTVVALIDPLKWAAGRGKSAQERVKKKSCYMPLGNLPLLQMLEKMCRSSEVDTCITLSDRGI